MSESAILAGLGDLNGDLCAEREVPFKPMTPADAVDELHRIGTELLAENGLIVVIEGVGVAPGHSTPRRVTSAGARRSTGKTCR